MAKHVLEMLNRLLTTTFSSYNHRKGNLSAEDSGNKGSVEAELNYCFRIVLVNTKTPFKFSLRILALMLNIGY